MVAGLRDEDVVERRLDELERLDHDPGLVERPHDRGDLGGAALELDQHACRPCGGSGLPNRREDLLGAASPSPPASVQLEVGLADLGLERVRRALGDDPAAVDDPDAVGELVGLLEVLGGEEDGRALVVERPTSSQIALRLTGSRPVVGSSRKSTSGSWTSADARSSRRCMPPE